jgi:hypothetical protein
LKRQDSVGIGRGTIDLAVFGVTPPTVFAVGRHGCFMLAAAA